MKFRTFLFGAATIAALVSTAAQATERVFDVTGTIRGRLDDGQLVIQHEEIPGYMPAMTMAFAVTDPAEAAALKPGEHVQFKFRVSDARSTAENFRVTGREAPAAVVARPASTSKSNRVRAGDAVPAFALINQNHQPFTPAELRDRFTIVTFIFTRCPVPEYCPAMALRFGQLQKAILADPKLAPRARLLSLTLDPEFDRPEILQAYGEAVGANSAVWQFATGAKDQIAALTKAFSVFNERNGVTLDHTLCTALISPDGKVIEIWRGNGWRVEEILGLLGEQAAKTPAATPACCHAPKS